MLKFLKWVKVLFWGTLIAMAVGTIVFATYLQNSELINPPGFPATNKASHDHPAEYRHAIEKSRDSTIQVRSTEPYLTGFSSLSGTYFIANGEHYVITAAHGIIGPCSLTEIIYDENYYKCEEYVVVDEINDYAIIHLSGKIPDRKPIRIPEDLPSGKQWKASYSLLNRIVYTGYPNAVGPLTLRGDVVGYLDSDYVYVFSYAYGGSSGAGVFTTKGKYIGFVTAIDVAPTYLGYQALENIVLVTPVFKVDWSVILN